MAQTTTTTPWAAEGIALSSREEKLASFLLSRGKTRQLERLLAKARAGVSTGLTSPAVGGHAHATVHRVAGPAVGAPSDDAHDGSALPATEAAPRAQPDVAPAEPAAAPCAQPDVLAPTPRPGRARLSVATPAPRPRRYATRSSRRGRAD